MNPERRLSGVFAAMAALLVGSIAAMFWIGILTIRRTQDIQKYHSVIDGLSQTLSILKDAETGQRGFLLTGDETYLKPYQDSVSQIHSETAKLLSRAEAHDLDGPQVHALVALIDKKLAELQQTIELRQQGHADAALAIVRSDAGKQVMDSIRDKIGILSREGDSEVQKAQGSAARYEIARTYVFAICAVVNLGFLAWAYGRIRREATKLALVAVDMMHQKELLEVTLGSIGDGVIVTDTQGGITYLNPVAQHLTGWKLAEASGQPCATVFRIVNEDTRMAVESPVEKVLRLGFIVGLANHTLLLRRDGSELPIDDSGAPIKESDGTIRGVVLVFRNFTEHKLVERNLQAAKDDLEAAAKAKDQFMAMLSHELRTPLTPVLATLTTWEASDELPASMLSDVQMLRRNVDLEARLIDDLLDLTRIVKGKFPLSLEVVDIHELVRAVAGMYHSEMQIKQIRLTMRLDAKRHHAKVDPARFQQICWNILKNATKFTPSTGSISVTSEDDSEGHLLLRFADTGIGMSKETLERLFRPFEQGTDAMVKRSGGLGLGMAISKALVDAQGGTIQADSPGEGLGSTFVISFQTVAVPVEKAAPSNAQESNLTPLNRRLRILLVEDHVDTATVMCRLLRRLGHEVETQGTVASAVESMRGQSFDLLLSDIGLPDGTGLDLIRQIREHYKQPAIALTGFGMEEDIAKCTEAGFDAHLTKPVSFQKLEMMIHQVAAAAAAV